MCRRKERHLLEKFGKNVGIWVWVRWSDVNNPANDWENMRRFFSSLSKTGIRGIKIDFMDSASQERLDFYDAVAENLAKNKLMVNFHGANTPTKNEIAGIIHCADCG